MLAATVATAERTDVGFLGLAETIERWLHLADAQYLIIQLVFAYTPPSCGTARGMQGALSCDAGGRVGHLRCGPGVRDDALDGSRERDGAAPLLGADLARDTAGGDAVVHADKCGHRLGGNAGFGEVGRTLLGRDEGWRDRMTEHLGKSSRDISGAPILMSAQLRRRKLFEDGFVTLMRGEHPAARRKLTLERYLRFDHIVVSVTGVGPAPVDEMLSAMGRTRRVKVRVPTLTSFQGLWPACQKRHKATIR